MPEENVVMIDGSEYALDNLDNDTKIYIAHVTSLQNEINSLQMKLVQLNAAKSVFLGQLKSALPET